MTQAEQDVIHAALEFAEAYHSNDSDKSYSDRIVAAEDKLVAMADSLRQEREEADYLQGGGGRELVPRSKAH